MRFIVCCSLALMALLLVSSPARAVTVNVTQPLDFGSWLITSNSGDYTVSIDTNGAMSHSPQLVMLRSPRKGIYSISDLPISTAITSINVVQDQPLSGPGGETFVMDSFQTDADSSTDPSGHLSLTLGATVHTSGSGTGYGHGLFTGHLNVEINY